MLSVLISSSTIYAQVGINTQSPNTIFDISAKRDAAGDLTSNDQTFGLQAPRLTRAELTNNTANYGSNQNGALIYITDISGGTNVGQREYITDPGYYYFDATANKWQKIVSGTVGGVYTASNGLTMSGNQINLGGALTGATTISNVSSTNKLAVKGDGVDAINFDENTLSIDATNNRIGIGTSAPSEKLDVDGNVRFRSIPFVGLTSGDGIMAVDSNGKGKKVSSDYLQSVINTNIYTNDGSLNGNRNANLNGYNLGFTGNGNVGIGTNSPSEKLDVGGNIAASGNGRFSNKLTVGSNWTGAAVAIDNKNQNEPILALSGTGFNRRVTILDGGNVGINTTSPSQKLDVDGNARFRSVPSGNMNSTDDYLAVSSDGTLKKVDVNLPALGLYAVTTGSVSHSSDGNLNNLNFNNTIKRDGNFIATSVNQNTFIAVKDGLYTVEVWAQFSNVPEASNDNTRGCSVQISSTSGGNTVQASGDRWNGGLGTTGLTKTFLLNANQSVSIYTRCIRTNNPNYVTEPNSNIFITYTPL
ncbi:hypothetical protein [Chryseobacterium sp. CBo1]|uniref:hypothetical protein n=1 Tax=Chryseobacterium sp. CBo1 TaxID=1869230 RepID=UPI000F507AEF|nr:hypothetical protein [Chryseobacterium sp. CBo1]